ncbi:MAG: dihydrofolate reductase [bacterium]
MTTEIIVIVAVAKNMAIGKNNDIPWYIKEDFWHFKAKTMGHPCIMGDKTFESLPDNARPLPGRENIVLSLQEGYKAEGATVLNDFKKSIEYVNAKGYKKAFITGGATIYKLGMAVADTFELTRIHKEFDADTFYPDINWDEWELVEKEDHESKEIKSGEMIKYSFETYRRKK